jgi:hypothetical protein
MPSGTFKPLSQVGGVSTSEVALRVIGEPPPSAPIDALEAGIQGTDAGLSFSPSPDGVVIALNLAVPITSADSESVVDGALLIRLVASTPGTFSFGSVQVVYT